MTYIGKGYGNIRDSTKLWSGIKNYADCKDLCKGKYFQDNMWNGCVYSQSGQWCEAEKNVTAFKATNSYDFWTLGENLFSINFPFMFVKCI